MLILVISSASLDQLALVKSVSFLFLIGAPIDVLSRVHFYKHWLVRSDISMEKFVSMEHTAMCHKNPVGSYILIENYEQE